MGYGLTITTPPAAEPVSLATAKLHCRIDSDTEDALITALIVAARGQVETLSGRSLITQGLRLHLDTFPAGACLIRLPGTPVQSVESVQWVNGAGDWQTLDAGAYRVALDGDRARLSPAYGSLWPLALGVPNAVRVNYTAGYGNAAAVPAGLAQAILLLVAHWYERREASTEAGKLNVTPMAVEALCRQHWVGDYP